MLLLRPAELIPKDRIIDSPESSRFAHHSLNSFTTFNTLSRNYKAIGWYNGQQGKMKLKDEKRTIMMRQKQTLRLNQKANKFQTYFRPQVIF